MTDLKTCFGEYLVQSFLAGLQDLVAQTYGNEVTARKLRVRHVVHVVDVWMLDYGIAQGLHVYAAQLVHQGRGLHASVCVSLMALYTGAESHVAISCAVDDGLCKNCLAPALGLDDYTLDLLAFLQDAAAEDVHQHIDSGLGHHIGAHILDFLAVNHGEGLVQLAGEGSGCSTTGPEALDELLGLALDNNPLLSSSITL